MDRETISKIYSLEYEREGLLQCIEILKDGSYDVVVKKTSENIYRHLPLSLELKYFAIQKYENRLKEINDILGSL